MSQSPDSALRSILQGCHNLHSLAGEEQSEIQPFLSQIENAGAEISRVLKKRTGKIFTNSILATVLAGKRLLVVEDNAINQRVILAMLNKAELGCLRLCENGQEALDALEAEDFDLVLMDINMPVMDGEQATRELRERGDTVPIIALTATPPDKRKRFIAAGMDGYLNKPVTVEALTREVNCVLTKTGSKPDFEETLVGETQDPQSKPKPCMDFDFEKFSMLFGHDGELCAEVAGEFMAQAVEEIERIGIAWKVMDYKQLENGFHKLAGSAFNVQAHRLGHLCRQGESLAVSEAPSSKIATAMEDVVLAFTHLRETLQTKLSVSNMPGTRSNA